MAFCIVQLFGGGHGELPDDVIAGAALFLGLASLGTLIGRVPEGLKFTGSAGFVGAADAIAWIVRVGTTVAIVCGMALLVISLGLIFADRTLRKASAALAPPAS